MNIYQELKVRIENRLKALNINNDSLPEKVSSILSKVRRDKYELSYSELKTLSEHLYVDPFLLVSNSYKPLNIKFRNLSGKYKNDIKSLEKIAYLLIKKGEIKKLNLPDYKDYYFELSKNIGDKKENLEVGRTLAKKLRKEKGIGNNPINVFEFAFSNGLIPIITKDIPFEGLLLLIGDYAFIFVKHSLSTQRMMFTVAHEIGHCVMHRGLELSLDNAINFETKIKEEITANYFASELLLPLDILMKSKNLNEIANYGLSKEALSYSIQHLKIKINLSKYKPKKFDYKSDIYPFTGNKIINELTSKEQFTDGLVKKINNYIYNE